MYRKHKRNREKEIYGVTVNIPPNGVIFNVMTNEWDETEILSRSAKSTYQYWERPLPPKDYEIKRKKEMIVQRTNPEYYNPELQTYRNQEWYRRLNGLWFYNNGKGTYLTGLHYFYLTHWKLDVGYPEFRYPDLEYFYFLDYCVQDPCSLGMIEVTKRRQGKCLGINELIRMYDGSIKKVQDIKDGEYVMGDDSKKRLVSGVTSGEEEMFKITTRKGNGFTCNKSHILHCIKNENGKHKEINISVTEYIKLSENQQKLLKMRRVKGLNSLNFGFKIESIGEGDYYGFAVDGNHLFLLADGTVIHNTMRAGAFLFELTSRSKNKNAGIQSKTYDDAKDNVFAKGVIMPFKYLPDFFVPIYDTEKGLTPKGELRFFKTNKRGANDDIFAEKVELESSITFKSSDKFAYDGTKLHRYVGDEAGKSKLVNVYERHQVVQFCLQQEENIIGKALYTTTVEEMEDGGEHFKELWKASNFSVKNENGRTKSGLYRYFLPAYKTLFYDRYGIPDEGRAKEFYAGERKALMDDNRALASYIRKNPFNIEEAFFSEAESCIYDALALNRQKESITWIDKKELYLQGDFVWKDAERDTTVVFIEKQNGKFKVHAKANVHDHNAYNQVEDYGTRKVPKDINKNVIAVDPFDHSITTSNERSDGAGYAYRKYDALDELSETFLVQYINRPEKAEIFYEDMIKLAHFFGCQVLSEDNKVGLIKYFEYRGYERFLIKMPNASKYGISATVKTHQQIAEQTESYITDNLKKVIFLELLDDWLKFNINKTTKFDAAMAAGYTLIAASKSKFALKQEQKVKLYDVREIFL